MNYHEWYAGRLVLDTDLDDTSDWILEAFEHGAYDASLSQDDATLNPKEYGGIVRGLGVILYGAAANLQVRVALGGCYDEAGQRAATTALATITLTHTGLLAKGATSGPATISPVLINPSTGQEVWVSLYLKHAEITSNTKTDLTGASVDFDVTESFQFEIRAGTPAAPPATSRDALANGRVLLADILIENPAGTIQIKTNGVCASNDDLDVLGYGPDDAAALDGRRSDWLAIENATGYPTWRGPGVQGFYIRAGSAREALVQLCATLADQTLTAGSPPGSAIIGAHAQAGSLAANPGAAISLAAGTLTSQLQTILAALNEMNRRGGNDSMIPNTNYHGRYYDPTYMDSGHRMLRWGANLGGGVSPFMSMDNRGVIHRGPTIMDHMLYKPTTATFDIETASPHWGFDAVGTGAVIPYSTNPLGGKLYFETTSGAGNLCRITTGKQVGGSSVLGWWDISSEAGGVMLVRFAFIGTLGNTVIRFGFVRGLGGAGGNGYARVAIDGAAGSSRVELQNSSGGVNMNGTDLDAMGGLTLTTGVEYNMRLAVTYNNSAELQVDDEAPILTTLSGGSGGVFATARYSAYFEVLRVASAGAATLDKVFVGNRLVQDGT